MRQFVIRREIAPKAEGKKPKTKAPKIQRLVTPVRLQRKRHQLALKRRNAEKAREAAQDYAKLLAKRVQEKKAQHAAAKLRRLSSTRKSQDLKA